MPSPPKPWEAANNASSPNLDPTPQSQTDPPSIPERNPSTLNSVSSAPTSLTTPYNRFSPYATSPYSSYSSPYSSFSSPYSPYNSSYSSYSAPYSSYTSPYNRFGSYASPNPLNPQPLQNSPTASTLDVLQQIIFAFSTFAQMLESTFHATQSSFFAMLGVADQFSHLKEYMRGIFSIMAMYGALKESLLHLLPLKRPRKSILSSEEFESFDPALVNNTSGGSGGRKPFSKKPLLFFLFAVLGVPYFLSWLRKKLELLSKNGNTITASTGVAENMQDSTNMEEVMQNISFAKALYDFNPRTPDELGFSKGDIIAVITRSDPQTGQDSLWWKGKLRKGPVGWFPANYVTMLKKQPLAKNQTPHVSIKTVVQQPQQPQPMIKETSTEKKTDLACTPQRIAAHLES